jgi:hypothetical protein
MQNALAARVTIILQLARHDPVERHVRAFGRFHPLTSAQGRIQQLIGRTGGTRR